MPMSLPSPQRNANDCEAATRVRRSLTIAGPGVVRKRVGDEGDAGLQHVDLDAMAAAAALALEQRAENAVAGKHSGGVVRDRRSARLRTLRIELQAGDPAQRHRDVVVGRTRAVGPRRAESGDRAMDQPRIGGREDVGSQAELFEHARPKVLQQDVGTRDELEHDRASRLAAQVEADAALAAVVGHEVGAVLPAAEAAEGIALRRLDLDHLGAEIDQHHAGQRRRDHGAELDHAHAFENVGHCAHARSPGTYRACDSAAIPGRHAAASQSEIGARHRRVARQRAWPRLRRRCGRARADRRVRRSPAPGGHSAPPSGC